MVSLKTIQEPVNEELSKFEDYFRETIKSDIPLLSTIINYVLRTKGKKVRPLIVFLAAKMFGEITQKTYIAATSIELLHTATLIHDDIIDESYERRNFFSINAIWKNKLSVLVGDFILAKGLLLGADNKGYEFIPYICHAVKDMSEGEIIQLRKSHYPDLSFETYYDIISKKTATLIASSVAIGALSVNVDKEIADKMFDIGINIGLAFQIKDDIFDYQEKGLLGKPTGNDLREQKFTLPLLYVVKKLPFLEKRSLLRKIKSKNKSQSVINEIVDLVIKHGGIVYATEQMIHHKNLAINALSDFPDTEGKTALINLIDYITVRDK